MSSAAQSVQPELATIPPALSRVWSPPVKVLHVINGEHYSGAERVQDLLASQLDPYGVNVGFACLKPGRFAAVRQSQQAPLVELPMRGRCDLRPAWQMAKLVHSEGYQLIHSHTPRAALVGRAAASLAGVPLVHHLHSPTSADSTRWLQNCLNAVLERAALARVSAVIAVSHSLSYYATRIGIAAERVSVVPNGVPILGALGQRRPPQRIWTLGMVALFRPRKGMEVLLEALALLRAEGHCVQLRAVGSFETPQYQEQILALVAKLNLQDAVEWTGFTRDVRSELGRFDLFVLPSLFGEGLPMVILEAMAAGVPVVATRVEGVPEAIREGIDGLLAAPGDAVDLAAVLRCYLAGTVDWQALRESAHTRQAERFSDVSMAAGVALVYDRVLAGQRGKQAAAELPPASLCTLD